MKLIPLTNSPDMACIDDADYPFIRLFTWRLKKSGYGTYVVTSIRIPGKPIFNMRLHRLIMGCYDKSKDVHHKDHNPLNCCRDNLEVQNSIWHRSRHRKHKQ